MGNTDVSRILGFIIDDHKYLPGYLALHTSTGAYLGNLVKRRNDAELNSALYRMAARIMWRRVPCST